MQHYYYSAHIFSGKAGQNLVLRDHVVLGTHKVDHILIVNNETPQA